MGDMADDLIDAGEEQWLLHLTGECGDSCPHCLRHDQEYADLDLSQTPPQNLVEALRRENRSLREELAEAREELALQRTKRLDASIRRAKEQSQ